MNTRFPEQPYPPQQPDFPSQQTKRTHSRKARLLGGVLALAFLLVSTLATALILNSTHLAHASGGAPTPTPPLTPTPTTGTPVPGQPQPNGSLYTAIPGSLTRTNLQTGKVAWTIQASYPSAPVIMGKTLFFANEDSVNPFLEAASAQTGAQIWRSQQYPAGFLLSSSHELYDSFCNFSATSDPCHLDGINASTGALLWSYDLPQGNAWIALQNGVLYGVSYTSYFALKASTGVPLWQKNLLNYPDQEANMTPAISDNVLSFASCNTTKQTSDYLSCYLYAFNASTGDELWHMAVPSSQQTTPLETTPAIMHGVVYAGAIDGTLYAVNEQNGKQLWSANAGGTIGQVLTNAGTVYVEIIGSDGQTFYIEAFNAATHALRWGPVGDAGQSQSTTTLLAERLPLSGGPASHPFVLEHELIYLQNSPTNIAVLNAANGSQVAQYPVSGAVLDGFTVVA